MPSTQWPQWGTGKGSNAGRVFEVTNRQEQLLAETVNLPNQLVWFPTKQDAVNYANAQNPGAYQAWESAQKGPVVNKVLPAAQGALNAATASPSSLTDFLGRLTEANVWLRVAEVAIGVVLISVGLAKMTNAVPAATKIAEVVK